MMQGKLKSILLLLVLASSMAFGQSKRVWMYKGDEHYSAGDYATALRYYHMVMDDTMGLAFRVLPYEAVINNLKTGSLPEKSESMPEQDSTRKVPVTDYVNHQMGMCYRYSHDFANAIDYFHKSAWSGKYNDDFYYLGNSLMYLSQYDSALRVFEHYMMLDEYSDVLLERALGDMSGCAFALKMEGPDEDIKVEFADTAVFNKGTSSFATMFWDSYDKIVFTSAREGSVIIDPEEQDPAYLCDLYWTEKKADGTWKEAQNFGRPLNSARHDASGHFKENIIYYTRWSNNDQNEKHIYLARMINMKFFEAYQMDSAVNIPGYQSINPYITEDKQYMYFSSDRPGGFGGLDLWRVELDETGNAMGMPQNLGRPVNSEFDELAPFYHEENNTLFFSSNGHESMGGRDIFFSKYDKDVGAFTTPENMGQPINSPFDESYYIIDKDYRFGFLTSNRGECTDCDSLYSLCPHCYKIYNVELPALEFKIAGYVYDEATNEIIPNATVEFKDVSYKWEHFEITCDENGYYERDLIPNLQLFLRGKHKGYFADKAIVFTAGEVESKIYKQDFYLEKIPAGEITIEGIEYDYDKATLRPVSMDILDKLIEFLELNDNLKIEIRSHTDERGSDDYNEKLSQRRAQSVVDYLIAHGIPMERLVPKGYGEKMPAEVPGPGGSIVTLTPEYIYAQPKNKQDELHQRNRRTAFFVLEEN